MEKAEQQILDLHGPVTPTFDNYIAGPNQMLVGMLKQLAADPEGWHYISGAPSSGKTHLLLAVMNAAERAGIDVRYLPLGSESVSADLIDQLSPPALLLLDDIDALARSAAGQESIFHCLNRMHQQGNALLAASNVSVRELDLSLPDLQSRLAKCQRHKINRLDEDVLADLIRAYLGRYALPADQKVVEYLIKHGPRNTRQIIDLLREVAEAALKQKRGITVPMVSSYLNRKADDVT